MKTNFSNENYEKIAKAIDYICNHYKAQPQLTEIAETVHMSPFHFQRLFTSWAGTSPKKILQYISVENAKKILKKTDSTLFDAAYETGLSGTGRLHDLFVSIEGMTPAEYKNEGRNLCINYSLAPTIFGKLFIASTQRGICAVQFVEEDNAGLMYLKKTYPNASFQFQTDDFHNKALSFFQRDWSQLSPVQLHLRGTPFQIKVWESLLKIPLGNLSTCGRIAKDIGQPQASRAVGTAIGSNPVAFLIPCHRVIQSSGLIGGYRWEPKRKKIMIGWEASTVDKETDYAT